MEAQPRTLGFLFADWVAAHCVVPQGFDLGKPFVLVGWQLENAVEFYRVKPDMVFIEYNGTWEGAKIMEMDLPKDWQIVELHMDGASASSARGGHVIINSGYDPDKYDKALAEFISGILPGRASTIAKRSDLANPKRAAVLRDPLLPEKSRRTTKRAVTLRGDSPFAVYAFGETISPVPARRCTADSRCRAGR